MISRLAVCLSLIVCWLVATGAPASAACGTETELGDVTVECEFTDRELSAVRQQYSDSKWELFQLCMDGTSGGAEVCNNPRTCELRGTTGTWYIVRRDGVTIGRACLTAEEAEGQKVDVRQLAIQAFKQLKWPGSQLVVQPPGGETLVNLDTIFYTTNAKPIPQVVTLANRTVTIEATPTSYTWHFDDDTSTTTRSPGHAYPDQDVVHVYEQTGDVEASVDTTYTGRFRIGDGEWQSIPQTLTVAGPTVGLTVLEAKPQLVIR